MCTLLANQAHLIKNTFALRASLIQQLFLDVIPLPQPCDAPTERHASTLSLISAVCRAAGASALCETWASAPLVYGRDFATV